MKRLGVMVLCAVFAAALVHAPEKARAAAGFNKEMSAYIKSLEAQARKEDPSFKGFDAERGRKIFFAKQKSKKHGTISCTTCHTENLRHKGRTTAGKVIDPLAPSVVKKRLTSVKEVKKWLRRNFRKVYGREGTAREKGDVLMFIKSQ